MKKLSRTLLIISLAAVLLGGFFLARELRETAAAKNGFATLAQEVAAARDLPSGAPDTSDVLPEYAALADNPEWFGWLRVPGTAIDYPVMQSPSRPDYYLNHGSDGAPLRSGTPYAEEYNTYDSDNITVYGHRMRAGALFSDLGKYNKKDFWQQHSIILFDTRTERREYEILAVFKENVYETDTFRYWEFSSAITVAEFDEFAAQCRTRSLYDTGVTTSYGDKLITLSTCDKKSYRLVVVGVWHSAETKTQSAR
ncbi:MAG: class B sortase [Oscillospiraceae bacterium]|jgi:sortase B|nr:class B sortase [Oscillospiraceae bacterium]